MRTTALCHKFQPHREEEELEVESQHPGEMAYLGEMPWLSGYWTNLAAEL